MSEKLKKRILIIKLSALGDFIQALGPCRAIRKHHADAHITLLTTKSFEGFAKDCGYFDEIWLDERPKFMDISGWWRLGMKLNRAKFTRIYDLQNNNRTNIYHKLLIKKTEWSGAAIGASHRNASPERVAGHAFDGHVQTLALAGISGVDIDRLEWMKGDISKFALKKPYVLLVPGCAPSRPEKRWPPEKYGVLAKTLSAAGFQPVIIGAKAEEELAEIIKTHCPRALDLTTKTDLKQIATLARGAAGAVGNDTGPMHIIGPTSCPSLVLFSGASNPIKHAPKGENVDVIQRERLENLSVEDVTGEFSPLTQLLQEAATMH
ncbi:MAG: glycosyltransferase family 9 protein [Micavibrio sp.]|nr:glycosyltransferase family 9 protein [Micavibrio sp.]